MGTKRFALIIGIFYIVIGVMGLIPALIEPPAGADGVTMSVLNGYLLGIFPVNLMHTVIHLLIGAWGLYAWRDYDNAKSYSRFVGIAFGLLFLMGLIPGLNTMFGMIPIYGADLWLHLATSLLGLYFGIVLPRQMNTRVTE